MTTHLLPQKIKIPARSESDDLELVGMPFDDIQRLAADGTGGTQQGDARDHGNSLRVENYAEMA